MTSWMDDAINDLQRTPIWGAGDTALSMGSSFIHGAARGLGGLLTLGATGSADAATDTIQNYQAPSWLPEYHPQTASGQAIVGGLEKFFVGYDEQVKEFTDLIATGDAPLIPKALQGPVGASYLYAAYMALPMMVGVGRTTGKPLPVRGYDKTSVQNALKNRAEKYLEPSYMSEVLKKVNPREWKRLSAAGLLESELATMGNAMHTAALEVPIVKDFVYRVTGDSGALGYFRPAQGAGDDQSWHPSGKGMEWAERKVGSSTAENQFKDASSDYYLYTAKNENIKDRFIDLDSQMKGFRGRAFELIPSGTPKEMRDFVDNFTREVNLLDSIQSGGKVDMFGEFPSEGKGIMIFKVPKGMTLEDLQRSDQSLVRRLFERDRANVEGRPEGQQELTEFEQNRINDAIALETDWSPWGEPNDSFGPSTPDQFTTRSKWVNYAIANNEVRILGSYNEGKIHRPEGVFTRGYPSFESAVEGGPLIGLNPRATSEAPIEGIGTIPKSDELDRLGELLGLDFNRGDKNKIKEVLKAVKKKWRTKRREGKTVEHEVDHFNDWLQARLLGRDRQPTDVSPYARPMVKDYEGRSRYIDPEKEYASLYDKDLVQLSELMLDSFERYKWNKNIANEMVSSNRVKNPTTHQWTPSNKSWEDLTEYEKRAIREKSNKYVLWSALELKPRLEELARYVRDTGKNLDDIILESASKTKHHGKGISDISDGLAYIFNRDPDLLPSISNLLETPQTQYPSQWDFDLFKSGAAMSTVEQEAPSPIPEWQGLITAGKLSAAGMQ